MSDSKCDFGMRFRVDFDSHDDCVECMRKDFKTFDNCRHCNRSAKQRFVGHQLVDLFRAYANMDFNEFVRVWDDEDSHDIPASRQSYLGEKFAQYNRNPAFFFTTLEYNIADRFAEYFAVRISTCE